MTEAVAAVVAPLGDTCPSCGRSWGPHLACQFCRSVQGLPAQVRLATPGRRLAGALLDGALAIVTLGIGYLVWSLVTYADGQSPGKRLLQLRCIDVRHSLPADRGQMIMRDWLGKWLIGLFSPVTLGVANLWLLWDANNQELWDKIAGTVVVHENAPAAYPGVRPRRSIVPALTAAFLVLVLLVCAPLAAVAAVKQHDRRGNHDLEISALAAGRQIALDIADYDYRTIDRDFTRVNNESTGKFRTDFATQAAGVRDAIVSLKAVSQAQIAAAGIVNVGSSSAQVVVALNRTVTNTQAPKGTTSAFGLQMFLVKRGGGWLVSQVNPL